MINIAIAKQQAKIFFKNIESSLSRHAPNLFSESLACALRKFLCCIEYKNFYISLPKLPCMQTISWPGKDQWASWQKILFRFFFVYFILYIAPWSFLDYVPGGSYL